MKRQHLEATLYRIDGREYKAYKDIQGHYDFPTYTLFIDHVQSDPFAPPSRMRARMSQRYAGLPRDLFSSVTRCTALEDYLTRRFAEAVARHAGSGSGERPGNVRVDAGGQEVLERSSCVVTPEYVELRFSVGLPARGRSVLGRACLALLCHALPGAIEEALVYERHRPRAVQRFVQVVEDQDALRHQLAGRNLIAFVADGSILPRASGVSDRPLPSSAAVPFRSPPELRVTLTCPHRGEVQGMGIPEGVTVIVGGGYHGKSTLLQAITRAVYNHVPGDGREYVVSRPGVVKTRAEDGRRVDGVDISAFIADLPSNIDTRSFHSENASGSTSQAANLVEAIEAGASALLMDEDTCATNFLIRDSRMQRLVAKHAEPITPLVDRIQEMYTSLGVSTVLVMGGSGDYLDVADTVIGMDHFEPADLTRQAKQVAEELPSARLEEAATPVQAPAARAPLPESLSPYRKGRVRATARGLKTVQFGDERIDLSAVEQLVDDSQTEAIADLLVYCVQRGYFDGRTSLRHALDRAYTDLAEHGLDVISPFAGQHPGDYAMPRLEETAAAVNRLRSLRVGQLGRPGSTLDPEAG